MKNKYYIFIISILIFIAGGRYVNFAIAKEILSFSGIKLGERVGNVKGLYYLKSDDDKQGYEIYIKENQKMTLEGIRLSGVFYFVNNEVIFSVVLTTLGKSNIKKLFEYAKKTYGDKFKEKEGLYCWLTSSGYAVLTFDLSKEPNLLVLLSETKESLEFLKNMDIPTQTLEEMFPTLPK